MTTLNQTVQKLLSSLHVGVGNWRFLLPGLPPQRTVYVTNGSLPKTVELISESTIEFHDFQLNIQPNSYDLAVAENPSQAMIQIAWSSLQEGGSCYFEWSSSLSSSSAIATSVIHAGFEDVRLI